MKCIRIEGYINAVKEFFFSLNLKDLKVALWGLSNYVTGGRQIRDFVDSGHIFDRILKLVDC
jgi:hypothetical protein